MSGLVSLPVSGSLIPRPPLPTQDPGNEARILNDHSGVIQKLLFARATMILLHITHMEHIFFPVSYSWVLYKTQSQLKLLPRSKSFTTQRWVNKLEFYLVSFEVKLLW